MVRLEVNYRLGKYLYEKFNTILQYLESLDHHDKMTVLSMFADTISELTGLKIYFNEITDCYELKEDEFAAVLMLDDEFKSVKIIERGHCYRNEPLYALVYPDL